jgi:KDO2-lipid IV(A) lauroyltransferase
VIWFWAAAGSTAERTVRRTLEYLAARAAIATLEHTPLPVANLLGRFYARLLDLAIPRLRRTAYQNLEFAFPSADKRAVTDGVFRSIGRLLVAVARFPQIRKDNVHEWIRYEGFEHYREAKRRGRGVLFATAHLGNWELSAYAHALMTEPMHVVVRPLDNPRVDALIESRRTMAGNRIIDKKDAARRIVRALRMNEPVGILIDQNVGLDEGVFVDFFGIPASAGTAFARLANRTGAAVIPGFALWSDAEQRYVLRFDPIIEMTGDDAADTVRIHERLEAAIREYPDQWLWVHRRWKTRPMGQDAIY